MADRNWSRRARSASTSSRWVRTKRCTRCATSAQTPARCGDACSGVRNQSSNSLPLSVSLTDKASTEAAPKEMPKATG